MTKILIAATALAFMTATASYGADPAATAPAGQKLTQAQCDSTWLQANPSGAATITDAQAKSYVSDFKAANPDNDGTLDKAEFSKACSMGLVSGSGSSGASSGDPGSSAQ